MFVIPIPILIAVLILIFVPSIGTYVKASIDVFICKIITTENTVLRAAKSIEKVVGLEDRDYYFYQDVRQAYRKILSKSNISDNTVQKFKNACKKKRIYL